MDIDGDSDEETIQLTQRQLRELLQKKIGLAECLERFNGEFDADILENFLHGVTIFKKVKKKSNYEALNELPLLFRKFAQTWWREVEKEVKTWE